MCKILRFIYSSTLAFRLVCWYTYTYDTNYQVFNLIMNKLLIVKHTSSIFYELELCTFLTIFLRGSEMIYIFDSIKSNPFL
jgi:hypothetical protein